MLLHPPTPRPSQGWGATRVGSAQDLDSLSMDIMEELLLLQVKLNSGFNLELMNLKKNIENDPVCMFTALGALKSPVSLAAGMPPPSVSSQYNASVHQNGAHT